MSISLETVGFWPRVWAFVVDTTCLTLLLLPLGFLVFGLSHYLEAGSGWGDLLLNFGLPFVLVFWFWKRWLATPGKMLIPAEIVDARSLSNPGSLQLVVRYLGYFVSMLPLGLGMLWVLVDPRHQAWHDKLAGTLVVRTEKRLISARATLIINVVSGLMAALLVTATLVVSLWTAFSGPGLMANYRQLQDAVDSGVLQGAMGTPALCWERAWERSLSCESAPCAFSDALFLRSCLDTAHPDPQICRTVLTDPSISLQVWQDRCQELSRSGNSCVMLLGTLSIYCRGIDVTRGSEIGETGEIKNQKLKSKK